jgi:TRAP-type mannitol/chloroaromatic compound transport system permease small subunit
MNKALSVTTTTLLLLPIANVFVDVVLRYAFNNSSIALQELEWHLFSAMFLLSIAYGLQNDTHVRVDVFYLNFSPKTQALNTLAMSNSSRVVVVTLRALFIF